MNIVMTGFARGRHFDDPDFTGTKIPKMHQSSFMIKINEAAENYKLVDGYAPFCKHLFVENWTEALHGVVKITDRNESLLHTGYDARREGELPVLTRWFDALDVDVEPAPYLDIILYSAEHLFAVEGMEIDGEWGIVSINSVSSPSEDPMPPITMMRNALGKDEGGSGVTLDKDAYARAVEFWSNHATVK
tara:strand:- start:742 stop:1311 length:570 start_codon:yes stop_codon:yes gene_type:complete